MSPVQSRSGISLNQLESRFPNNFLSNKQTDIPLPPRDVWLVYLLPLLGLLTLRSLMALPMPGVVWPLAALGAVVGLKLGQSAMSRYVLSHADGRLEMCGEWLTLATMMGLFWVNFALNTAAAMAPALYAAPEFNAIAAALLGTLAGLFPGRAIYVARMQDAPLTA